MSTDYYGWLCNWHQFDSPYIGACTRCHKTTEQCLTSGGCDLIYWPPERTRKMTETTIAGFCPECNTKPCVCRRPDDTVHTVGHYHFTPNTPSLDDIRKIVREELEKIKNG